MTAHALVANLVRMIAEVESDLATTRQSAALRIAALKNMLSLLQTLLALLSDQQEQPRQPGA